MSDELKPCPWCKSEPERNGDSKFYFCSNIDCEANNIYLTAEQWNTRPIEDALRARIAALEKVNSDLRELLRDFVSQDCTVSDGTLDSMAISTSYAHPGQVYSWT